MIDRLAKLFSTLISKASRHDSERGERAFEPLQMDLLGVREAFEPAGHRVKPFGARRAASRGSDARSCWLSARPPRQSRVGFGLEYWRATRRVSAGMQEVDVTVGEYVADLRKLANSAASSLCPSKSAICAKYRSHALTTAHA
jgi:hypothetical protein